MFPITEEYIEREYTIAGNHLMLTSEHTAREIEQKARKVMGMLKRGVKFTPMQPDVMTILEKQYMDTTKEKERSVLQLHTSAGDYSPYFGIFLQR